MARIHQDTGRVGAHVGHPGWQHVIHVDVQRRIRPSVSVGDGVVDGEAGYHLGRARLGHGQVAAAHQHRLRLLHHQARPVVLELGRVGDGLAASHVGVDRHLEAEVLRGARRQDAAPLHAVVGRIIGQATRSRAWHVGGARRDSIQELRLPRIAAAGVLEVQVVGDGFARSHQAVRHHGLHALGGADVLRRVEVDGDGDLHGGRRFRRADVEHAVPVAGGGVAVEVQGEGHHLASSDGAGRQVSHRQVSAPDDVQAEVKLAIARHGIAVDPGPIVAIRRELDLDVLIGCSPRRAGDVLPGSAYQPLQVEVNVAGGGVSAGRRQLNAGRVVDVELVVPVLTLVDGHVRHGRGPAQAIGQGSQTVGPIQGGLEGQVEAAAEQRGGDPDRTGVHGHVAGPPSEGLAGVQPAVEHVVQEEAVQPRIQVGGDDLPRPAGVGTEGVGVAAEDGGVDGIVATALQRQIVGAVDIRPVEGVGVQRGPVDQGVQVCGLGHPLGVHDPLGVGRQGRKLGIGHVGVEQAPVALIVPAVAQPVLPAEDAVVIVRDIGRRIGSRPACPGITELVAEVAAHRLHGHVEEQRNPGGVVIRVGQGKLEQDGPFVEARVPIAASLEPGLEAPLLTWRDDQGVARAHVREPHGRPVLLPVEGDPHRDLCGGDGRGSTTVPQTDEEPLGVALLQARPRLHIVHRADADLMGGGCDLVGQGVGVELLGGVTDEGVGRPWRVIQLTIVDYAVAVGIVPQNAVPVQVLPLVDLHVPVAVQALRGHAGIAEAGLAIGVGDADLDHVRQVVTWNLGQLVDPFGLVVESEQVVRPQDTRRALLSQRGVHGVFQLADLFPGLGFNLHVGGVGGGVVDLEDAAAGLTRVDDVGEGGIVFPAVAAQHPLRGIHKHAQSATG